MGVLCLCLLRSSDVAMVDSTTISTDVPGAPRRRSDKSTELRSAAEGAGGEGESAGTLSICAEFAIEVVNFETLRT
jgi:hypothetical protein